MDNRRQGDANLEKMLSSIERLHEKMDEQRAQTSSIDSRLNKLEDDYIKYKSFFGGMIFVLSAMWAFFVFVWANVKENVLNAINLR